MIFIAFNAFGPGFDAGDLDDASRQAGFDVYREGQLLGMGSRQRQESGIGI